MIAIPSGGRHTLTTHPPAQALCAVPPCLPTPPKLSPNPTKKPTQTLPPPTVAAVHEGAVLPRTVLRSPIGGALLTAAARRVLERELESKGSRLMARHMFRWDGGAGLGPRVQGTARTPTAITARHPTPSTPPAPQWRAPSPPPPQARAHPRLCAV